MSIRFQPSWPLQQRKTLLVLLGGACIYLIVRLVLNPVYVSNPQPPEPSRAAEVEDRINPNLADVPTLAALPSIGDKRAQDIIAYRENFVSEHPGEQAFKTAEDLRKIRGIGPAMVMQLSPYLIFSSGSPSTTRPAE